MTWPDRRVRAYGRARVKAEGVIAGAVTIELSGDAADHRPEDLASLLAERLGERIDLVLSFQPVYRGLSVDE
jgi:hypothetical protein